MNPNRSQELQVGIAVVLSSIILVVGLLWFQDYKMDAARQDLRVRFEQVGGLGTGDEVHVRGIPMGKVGRIELTDDGVIVDCQIDTGVPITDTATFRLMSIGLVGERVLFIDPGAGQIVQIEGRLFEGVYDLSMPEMAAGASDIMSQLEDLLKQLGDTLAEVQESGGVGGIVADANRAVKGLADFVDNNKSYLQKSARSMASASAKLDTLLTDNRGKLSDSLAKVDGITTNADSLLVKLNQVTDDVQVIMAAIKNEDGVVGKLIMDGELAAEIEGALQEVHLLIADIRRNPDRYLQLKLLDI